MVGKSAISLPQRRRKRFLDCQLQAIEPAIELTVALLSPLERMLLTPKSDYDTSLFVAIGVPTDLLAGAKPAGAFDDDKTA